MESDIYSLSSSSLRSIGSKEATWNNYRTVRIWPHGKHRRLRSTYLRSCASAIGNPSHFTVSISAQSGRGASDIVVAQGPGVGRKWGVWRTYNMASTEQRHMIVYNPDPVFMGFTCLRVVQRERFGRFVQKGRLNLNFWLGSNGPGTSHAFIWSARLWLTSESDWRWVWPGSDCTRQVHRQGAAAQELRI